MSLQREPSPLRATGFKFEAPVNSCCYSVDGSAFAFGFGDGSVHVVHEGQRRTVKAHEGAVPVVLAYDDGFMSLSDDGTLKKILRSGAVEDVAAFKGVWTEKLAVHANGSFAVAVGRHVHLWTRAGTEPKILGPHDGSVTDVSFAPDGQGLAAAHRDAVTLWSWPHFEPQAKVLTWKGAHLAVMISPDKRWVASAMQEGALHLWNLALKRDYQMRGYWSKPTRMAWSHDRKWLATSGAETAIIWPFDKAGPEGREPLQLGWSNGSLVTAVAAHPDEMVMVAGFEDGGVTMLDVKEKKAFTAAQASGQAITCLAFSPMGSSFIAGSANGGGVLYDFDS